MWPSPTLGSILKAEVPPRSTKQAVHNLQRVIEELQHNTMLLIQIYDRIQSKYSQTNTVHIKFLWFYKGRGTPEVAERQLDHDLKKGQSSFTTSLGWWSYQHTWCNVFLEAEASPTSVNKQRKWNTTCLKPKGYDELLQNTCIFRKRVKQTQATKETDFQDCLDKQWTCPSNQKRVTTMHHKIHVVTTTINDK